MSAFPSGPIVCLGTSPAWQRTLTLGRLALGEVNRAEEVLEYASGKPVNVARVVTQLGGKARLLIPLGGDRGRRVRGHLVADGIGLVAVEAPPETRMCITLLDAATSQATELIELPAPLPAEVAGKLMEHLRHELPGAGGLVMGGSLAPGIEATFYARAIELARDAGVRTLLDAQGDPLLTALGAGPDLVKMNADELSETLGLNGKPREQAAGELVRRGAGRVVITLGAAGCESFDGSTFQHHPAPAVRAVNPIGSGDAFAAALATGLAAGLGWNDAISLALACGTGNARTLRCGDVPAEDLPPWWRCSTSRRGPQRGRTE